MGESKERTLADGDLGRRTSQAKEQLGKEVLDRRSADEEAQKKFREELTAELGRERTERERENAALKVLVTTARQEATALRQERSADTATNSRVLQSLENHMTEQLKHAGQGLESEARDRIASDARTEKLCLELRKAADTDRANYEVLLKDLAELRKSLEHSKQVHEISVTHGSGFQCKQS